MIINIIPYTNDLGSDLQIRRNECLVLLSFKPRLVIVLVLQDDVDLSEAGLATGVRGHDGDADGTLLGLLLIQRYLGSNLTCVDSEECNEFIN